MKKTIIVFILFALAVASGFAQKSSVFNTKGVAINGYDVVAFFSDSNAIKGDVAFAFHWQGVDWLFTNNQHRETFKNAPEKYAPAYGGYCAYGTADGHKAPTEIDTWTITGGKLYFNYHYCPVDFFKKW